MGYNALDLLDKAIIIAIKIRTIYEKISHEKCDIEHVKVFSTVLIKQVNKHIQYLEALKKELINEDFEDIDFGIYDKMSFLINEFNKKIYISDISNVRSYLKFSLELEKDALSLLIDIQGRYVKTASDTSTKTYKLLSAIINLNAKYVATLEKMLTAG